ncbi:barstar family protein [Streptomyces sp. NPDC015131]|uniref:barstar family protein n=1 Tax=Streptomyces sp. NPDC015131 TaxID=3364941 RepID=UPI00370231F0
MTRGTTFAWRLVDDEDDSVLAEGPAVDRLFADPPPPPPRERWELLGCAPEGPLQTAVATARATGSGPVGLLTLESLRRGGDVVTSEWDLRDVRVTGVRPCARDLSLLDLSLEAVRWDEATPDLPAKPPLSPGYRLSTGWSTVPLGTAKDVVLIEPPGPAAPAAAEPVHLLGGAPGTALLTALARDDDFTLRAGLELLDRTGRPMWSALASWYVTSWQPSPYGPGLVDLMVAWDGDDRPRPAARRAHELWADGPPPEKDRWTELCPEGRWAWLRLALGNHGGRVRPAPADTDTHHLDGRHVTDLASFYCALGETLNGPGGYYGGNLGALSDCLSGGFGPRRPFTLVWHDSGVARRCLGAGPLVDAAPTFEELTAFLAREGVRVVLA